jgi:hypothetical protein
MTTDPMFNTRHLPGFDIVSYPEGIENERPNLIDTPG